jgi:hypothetical protein
MGSDLACDVIPMGQPGKNLKQRASVGLDVLPNLGTPLKIPPLLWVWA